MEGCTQIIEDPERCLVHDGDLVEIDITENTAIHRVHGYLTNDGFMVSIWKFKKRNNTKIDGGRDMILKGK